MSEIRVTRRLVKSPPELWAEVSDAAALAQRLGELGDIRITRVEPETTVAWEGEQARGTAVIEGSGWGTAVTITVEATAVEEAPPKAEPAEDTPPEAPPKAEPAEDTPPEAPPAAVAPPEPEREPVAETPAPPSPAPDPAPPPPAPDPTPEGFLARLFRRRPPAWAEVPEPQPDPAPLPDPDPLPEPSPQPEPEPLPQREPLPEPEPAAAAKAEPVTESEPQPGRGPSSDDLQAVLERALDDLGAAHHRPFSRA